jgi:hypothetical protein
MVLGQTLFPEFFQYKTVPVLWQRRRRRRSHFSFMAQRRMKKIKSVQPYTVFVLGVGSRSIPIGTNFKLSSSFHSLMMFITGSYLSGHDP